MKQSSFGTVVGLGVVIIAATIGYFSLPWSRSTAPKKFSSNITILRTEGSITINPLTPTVQLDQPSDAYQTSVLVIDPATIPEATATELTKLIIQHDPETHSQAGTVSILFVSHDTKLALYIIAGTGERCIPPGGMGSCPNAKLKVFNTIDKSPTTLVSNFGNGQGEIYYVKSKDEILVNILGLQGNAYEQFSLSAPYQKTRSIEDGVNSLLENEYLISYNQKLHSLSLENILNGKKLTCSIQETALQASLETTPIESLLSIAPSGNKLVMADEDNTLYWNNLESRWRETNTPCFSNSQKIKLDASKFSSLQGGKWYSADQYFASIEYGRNPIIFDLNLQKQIFNAASEWPITVGYRNNSGYHGTTNLGYKGYQLQTTPTDGGVELAVISSTGDKTSIQTYRGPESYYRDGRTMQAWVIAQQDGGSKNLFHLLVLDGYHLIQALDLTITN